MGNFLSKSLERKSDSASSSAYTLHKHGRPRTAEFRVFFEKDGVPLSPFHDIPLHADEEKQVFNMVVEVPRWTNAKYEISRSDVLNPIHQDGEKTGPPRFVKNRFPHHGYIGNYGALPQTWEDPHHVDKDTKVRGDNDPIDACDISQHVSYTGEVQQVKVLGILALIDSGETDWKLIVIDVRDPRAAELHDIDDVERLMPGYLTATREWFRLYKVPDGDPENEFAFDGQYRNREFALKTIYECSEAWENLITGKTEPGDVDRTNVTVGRSPFRVDPRKLHIPKGEDLPPAPLPKHVEEWFFLSSGDNPG